MPVKRNEKDQTFEFPRKELDFIGSQIVWLRNPLNYSNLAPNIVVVRWMGECGEPLSYTLSDCTLPYDKCVHLHTPYILPDCSEDWGCTIRAPHWLQLFFCPLPYDMCVHLLHLQRNTIHVRKWVIFSSSFFSPELTSIALPPNCGI